MNTKRTISACLLIVSLCPAVVVAQEAGSAKDRSAQVQAIFAAKCYECHGPQVSPPKGGLSLHHLAGLAAADLIVPAHPEKSALWEMIEHGEMPPSDAQAGPLSEQEKEAVRAWIKSLPPVASPGAPPDTVAPAASPARPQQSIFGWLGRFHILAIHFPIALLAAAAFGEVLAAARQIKMPQAAVRFCVLLGAAGALAAVGLGWLHADSGGYGRAASSLLGLHRWLGTGAGLCAVALVLLSERDWRRGQRSMPFRVLLWGGTLLVGAAAHFGGLLVHGVQFLAW
jgi:mono/diheme cytochrome c family protein